MTKHIYLDTETTGISDSDRIIQLGFMVVDSSSKDIEVHNGFCLPDVPLTISAMETHHVTPDQLVGKPSCIDMLEYKRLLELNNDGNILIIHNASFDLKMLEKEGFKNEFQVVDTLRCAKHLYTDEKAHRLQYLRYSLGLYKNEKQEAERLGIEIKAHDAIGDVLFMKILTSALLKKVAIQQSGSDSVSLSESDLMQNLVNLTNTPVLMTKPLAFGKHKGKTILEVVKSDAGYLNWMMENMNLDDDMRYTISESLK